MAKTFWSDTLLKDDVAITNFATRSLLSDMDKSEQRVSRITLLRTIVGFDVAASVHDSGEGSSTMDIGIGIASQEAFAAGNLPDPNTATDYPLRGWVFRARGRVFHFASTSPQVFTWRVDRDIRSRRVLDNGEPYIKFQHTLNEGAQGVLRITGLVRCLWLVR